MQSMPKNICHAKLLESSYQKCPYRAKKPPLSPSWSSIPHFMCIVKPYKVKHKGGGNECSICESNFKDNYGLKRHLSSHEEKAQHRSICNKNLKEHSKHCTKEKSEQRYSCHYCDKKYALRRCLKVYKKKNPMKPLLHILAVVGNCLNTGPLSTDIRRRVQSLVFEYFD